MTNYLIFVVCLSFLCKSTQSQLQDDFVLVLQWPSTVNHAVYSHSFVDFSIYGLWPRLSGQIIDYCTNAPIFDFNKISGLQSQLGNLWPNLITPPPWRPQRTDVDFWEYQWQKHGRCARMDQHAYFSTALALRTQLGNLIYPLIGSGFELGLSYAYTDLMNGLEQITGFRPGVVTCDSSTIVKEIYFCVDRTFHFYDCSSIVSTQRACTAYVTIPL